MAIRYDENCVYAVSTPVGIKIGFTSRLGDRISSLQRQYSQACYPIALITGLSRSSAMDAERRLHDKLSEFSVRSEIFDVSPEIVRGLFAGFKSGVCV